MYARKFNFYCKEFLLHDLKCIFHVVKRKSHALVCMYHDVGYKKVLDVITFFNAVRDLKA